MWYRKEDLIWMQKSLLCSNLLGVHEKIPQSKEVIG